MSTVLTVIAGLVLAGAATLGVVVSQSGGPTGNPNPSLNLIDGSSSNPAALYDAGK